MHQIYWERVRRSLRKHSLTTLFRLSFLLFLTGSSAYGCASTKPDVPYLTPASADSQAIYITVADKNGHVNRIELEDYLLGTILSEASFKNLNRAASKRVAEVQAILARTYAISNLDRHKHEGFNLCSTTHCQVHTALNKWPQHLVDLANDAITTTHGVVIGYNNLPINAVFHAACGGHTSDAEKVWIGTTPPYLRGAPDRFCHGDISLPWTFQTDLATLRQLLNKNRSNSVGRNLDRITVLETDIAGRVQKILFEGEKTATLSGESLRRLITSLHGPRSIRSTKFKVVVKNRQAQFIGTGFGHGVGLCQTGTMARARLGETPQAILKHYYPGTTLIRIGQPHIFPL